MVTVTVFLLNTLSICTHAGSQPEKASAYLLALIFTTFVSQIFSVILQTYTFCDREIQF